MRQKQKWRKDRCLWHSVGQSLGRGLYTPDNHALCSEGAPVSFTTELVFPA